MTADALRKSILQQAIQGKLSKQLPTDGDAHALLREIQAEKLRLIAEKKIKSAPPLPPITADEIHFDIPQNWCWARLGDICEMYTGNSISEYEKKKNIRGAQKVLTSLQPKIFLLKMKLRTITALKFLLKITSDAQKKIRS